jgi:hypothetical protein
MEYERRGDGVKMSTDRQEVIVQAPRVPGVTAMKNWLKDNHPKNSDAIHIVPKKSLFE